MSLLLFLDLGLSLNLTFLTIKHLQFSIYIKIVPMKLKIPICQFIGGNTSSFVLLSFLDNKDQRSL